MSELARGGVPALLALVLVCGCGGAGEGTGSAVGAPPPGAMAPAGATGVGSSREDGMRIESDSFEDGARIPARFTCSGEDVSPALRVEDLPEGVRTLALVVDDPDAPRGTFVHWLIWNVPADRREIPEAVPPDGAASTLGGRTAQGANGMRRVGYSGPCPPPGRGEHTYRFQLYALDSELELPGGADREQLERAMDGHVLARALLKGRFGR